MTANIRILIDDLIVGATLNASPALEATLPPGNLRTIARSEVARSTSTADQAVTGNFAALSACSCCVLWRHNLSAAATWRLELFSAVGQGGATVHDSGAVPAMTAAPLEPLLWGYDPLGGAALGEWQQPARHSALYFDAVNARSFRLTLADPANPDGYLQASRLLIGAYWEPSIGADYGAELQFIDDSTQARSAAGTLRTPVGRAPVRQLSVEFSALTLADSAALARIVGRCGRRAEVWVSLYPGWAALDPAYADAEYLHGFVGKLVAPHAAVRRGFATHSDRLVVQEA